MMKRVQLQNHYVHEYNPKFLLYPLQLQSETALNATLLVTLQELLILYFYLQQNRYCHQVNHSCFIKKIIILWHQY